MSHRQSVSLFVALCLLAASTCTYFAFFEGDDSEVESSLQKGQTSAETVQAPSTDLVDQEAAPEVAPEVGELQPREQEDERVDATSLEEPVEDEQEPAELTYVTGRVALGFDLPADEVLWVASVDRERGARSLYGNRGVVDPIWSPGEEHHGLISHARVEPDGSFRVGLSADADEGFLALTGRYVISKRTTRVSTAEGSPEPVLTGELGSWITGQLRVPSGLAEDVPLGGIEMELGVDITAAFNPMEMPGVAYDMEVETDAEGRFEFRGVSSVVSHGIIVHHEDLAETLILGLRPEPGEHRELNVRLQEGATLKGMVVDESGAGVPGAELEVTLRGTLGDSIGDMRKASTDAEGNFVLEHVVTGHQIEIHAEVEGMRPGELKLEDKLRDGQLLEGLRIELREGLSIAGRLLYPDGQPVSEGEVRVVNDLTSSDLAMMGARAAAMRRMEVESDEEGRFEVKGLDEGTYMLAVKHENDEGAHEGKWRARQGGVTGGTTGLVLELEGLTPVAGFVTTESERELETFTVQMTLQGSGGMMGVGAERLREEFDYDAEGGFEKENVPPGVWDVTVVAAGFARSETQEVTVPQGEGLPLPEFALVPAAGVQGTVYDTANQPVAGAKVTLELDLASRINVAFSGEQPSALSDHEGRFTLGDLDPGSLSVVAGLDGFADSEPFAVDLEPGQLATDVNLVLRLGGTVYGQVLGAEGKPAVGRMVIVQRLPSYASQHMGSSDSDGEFSFEHLEPGQWQVVSMPNMMTGELDVGSGDGMGEMLSDLKMDMVDVVDGGEHEVILGQPPEDPVQVLGSVTHDGGGIPGALVSFISEKSEGIGDLKMTTTNEEGNFSVQLDNRGHYIVNVQNNVGTGRQNNLEFQERIPEEGETHRLELKLPRAAIAGKVIGLDGKPAPNCRVSLNVDGGIPYGSLLGGHFAELATDAEGRYQFDYVRPGSYTVSAGGATMAGVFGNDSLGGRVVRDGIQVAEDQLVKGVDFRLEEPGSLGGVVYGLDGQPVSGAAVFVRDAAGRRLERFSMINTDNAGRYEYHGLGKGEYSVAARKGGSVSEGSGLVSVRAGETSKADVTLGDGTVFLISVIDRTGATVDARVQVINEAGHEIGGMLSLNEMMNYMGGGFSHDEQRVGPVPPGKYRVEVTLEDGRSKRKSVRASGQSERKLKIRID